MSWDQYNQTPASNDLSGYFATGMRPSAVKNAGWDIMADLAQFMSLPTSGGTANAQTVTNTRQFGALFTGMTQWFIPGNTNTGAVTLAIDGLTAKNVFANGVSAIAGMLVSGVPALVKYDGTQWNLLNPQRSTGSFTGTLTGYSPSAPSGTVNYAIEPSGKKASAWIASAISNANSSTTAMTMTGVPAILTTGTGKGYACAVVDSNAASAGFVDTGTSTTWSFYKGGSLSGFTSSGTKGLGTNPHFSFLFDLD